MSVEIILLCKGTEPGHEFVEVIPDPVDWQRVSRVMQSERCENHPEFTNMCDWD
jgi:hypothetical protein